MAQTVSQARISISVDRLSSAARIKGNPAERMLESCATVEEAITFFQKHWEPSFSYARILIADRTGASVILGAKDGSLAIERANNSRAMGYRGKVAEDCLAQKPEPTPANAAMILRTTIQEGQYATKYQRVRSENGEHLPPPLS